MSVTNVSNTRNQSFSNYDFSKLLLGDNDFDSNDYTDSGAGSTLLSGLLLGKIAATGLLVPLAPAAADGSQFPIGLLWLGGAADVDVAISATVSLEYVNKGRVREGSIALPAGVTLDDVIVGDGRTVKDYLNALGLSIEGSIELTGVDNS